MQCSGVVSSRVGMVLSVGKLKPGLKLFSEWKPHDGSQGRTRLLCALLCNGLPGFQEAHRAVSEV